MRSATQASIEAPPGGARELAAQIYREHRSRLLAIARRNSAGPEEAEEALQDAFVLFIAHFEPSSAAPPVAWLTLTLKRRCWALYGRRRREWRRAGSYRDCSEEASASGRRERIDQGTEQLAERRRRVASFGTQLASLKPQERRALALLGLGYSYREICALTGWTYTKVNRCISEGRASLRAQSEEHG